MHWLDTLKHQAAAWVGTDREPRTATQRTLRYGWDLGRFGFRQLREDRAGQMAAALTYHTLFSMLPTIVLALVILKQFVGPDDYRWFTNSIVEQAVQWLEATRQDKPVAVDEVTLGTAAARVEFAQTADVLRTQIEQWIARLSSVSFGSIGVVGVLLFIYGATGLLATVERSFNLIYDAPTARSWLVRVPLYYTVITLGPLVLVAGRWLQTRIFGLLAEASWTNWLVGPLGVVAPLVTTWLVIFAMYALLPNARVRLRPAAVGALLAAIGWVVAIELFTLYVGGAAVATLYGALALLPLFLMWLWIAWIIVLFGLEVAYTLQSLPGHRLREAQAQQKHEDHQHLLDPRWLIPLMTLIVRGFRAGQPVRADQAAHELRLPRGTTTALCDQLVQDGLLHRVEPQRRDESASECTYTLARPPESITVEELLASGQRLSMGEQTLATLPGRSLIERLHGAQRAALGDATLAAAE